MFEHTTPNCWASETVANAHLDKHQGAISLRNNPHKPNKSNKTDPEESKDFKGNGYGWETKKHAKNKCTKCNNYHVGECRSSQRTNAGQPKDNPDSNKSAKEEFPNLPSTANKAEPNTAPKSDTKSWGAGKGKSPLNPGAAPHIPSSDKEGAGKGSG